MSGIGESLREARIAAGIRLDDAERSIRIRTRYLEALEHEEWDALPGEAYARGFLRTYADHLGLDGAALVDEYDRRAAPVRHEPAPRDAPFEPPRPLAGNATWRRVGWGAIAVAAVLAALFIVLGITGGSGHDGNGKHGGHHRKHASGSTSTTTTAQTPSQASVSLTPTGTVWVCLVDQSGRPLVNGETLAAGDTRGPFKAPELKLTLGNGEMRIDLNGKQVPIPSSANPVGFDLTPEGAKPLSSADRPTCA